MSCLYRKEYSTEYKSDGSFYFLSKKVKLCAGKMKAPMIILPLGVK